MIPARLLSEVCELRSGRIISVQNTSLVQDEKPVTEIFVITALMAKQVAQMLKHQQIEEAYQFLQQYGTPVAPDLEFERIRPLP